MSGAVGIDFGTTNSVLAHFVSGHPEVVPIDQPPADWGGEYANLLPTVFAMTAEREPLFGWRAKQRPDHRDAIKRLLRSDDEFVEIGGERFYIEEAAALLFSHLRRQAQAQGVDFERAVVTVPANSRGLARFRTKLCAGMAGIEVLALINEPTAAAMAFGLNARDDQKVLVVDWGGGTLDVTLLNVVAGVFMEQASKGIQVLGGIDFDREIFKRLVADLPDASNWSPEDERRALLEVERAKIALSTTEEVSVALPGGIRRLLTRKRMQEWCEPLIMRVREPIATCLADVGMTAQGIDHLLLVGGTCMMPPVRDAIAEIVGREPARNANAMTAVAEGAAVAAAILDGAYDSDFFVSTEHALGAVVVDNAGNRQFSEIIPRNQKLPAKQTDSFFPVTDMQDSVMLQVVEGDPSRSLSHEDNVILKEWEVPLIPRPLAEARVEVTYAYDTNGILTVEVADGVDGTPLFRNDVSFTIGRDPKELVTMATNVEELINSAAPLESALPAEIRLVLDRARDKVIPFVPDDEAERIDLLADALESDPSSPEALEALNAALRKFAYLF